jgi:hypothetical protein
VLPAPGPCPSPVLLVRLAGNFGAGPPRPVLFPVQAVAPDRREPHETEIPR